MRSINEWVAYTQTLHAREIELKLDRVKLVFDKLFPNGIAFKVISVAGTNGKGSCVAMLHSILYAQGYTVAQYTSPHLLHFNERFKINNRFVSDIELQQVYQVIEDNRGDIALTFFEFATLAAIYLFEQENIDVAIMEVGLGGRLDAVNILDADVSIISSIGLDHMDWLGDNIEQIAFEKVGIARQGKPCVVGMPSPPVSIIKYCKQSNIPLYSLDTDFSFTVDAASQTWAWHSKKWHGNKGKNSKENNQGKITNLQMPLNGMRYQLNNGSVVLQALKCIDDVLPVDQTACRAGMKAARLFARCQLLQVNPYIVLDVAHNVDAAQQLATFIQTLGVKGRVFTVCGMLQDKQVEQCYQTLAPYIDEWYLATLQVQRGMSAEEFKQQLSLVIEDQQALEHMKCFDSVMDAYINAKNKLEFDDCLLVFGSFHTVSDIISYEKVLVM